MAIRRIRDKERQRAGNIYCDHCKPDKVKAVWRLAGLGASHQRGDFACEAHRHCIKDNEESEHMSEADYQTWGRM